MKAILDRLNDPYERKARVVPGLLVALPILIPLVCVYGARHPVLTGVIATLGGCGAIFALANVARGRGKRLEESLVKSWGGMPTTVILRHRDTFFDHVTKDRYHADIRTKLGIQVPTAEQEAEDPSHADRVYTGIARHLRELTRSDKQLLLKENIAYGFHRNMLAMKRVGIVTSIIGLLYALTIGKIVTLSAPYLEPANLLDPGLASGVSLLVSVGLLAAWLFYFNESAVRRIGFVYAERLFEALGKMKALPKKKQALG